MPDPPPEAHNLGYPCYGAVFLDQTRVACAGGGGAGNVGLANRMTVLNVGPDGKLTEEYHKDIPQRVLNSGEKIGEEALRVATPSNPAAGYEKAVALTLPAR